MANQSIFAAFERMWLHIIAVLGDKIEDALTNAKENGEFDGKSAYSYAQDGGYTGTEEEFAQKLALDTSEIVQEVLSAMPYYTGETEVIA